MKVLKTEGTLEHVWAVHLSPHDAAALSLQTPGRFGLLYLFAHSDFTWEWGGAGVFVSSVRSEARVDRVRVANE